MDNTTKNTVQTISKHVNSLSQNSKEFCELMANEHRTIQQSFTRLCMEWMEHVASDNYRYDGRNEASRQLAVEIKSKIEYLGLPLI